MKGKKRKAAAKAAVRTQKSLRSASRGIKRMTVNK